MPFYTKYIIIWSRDGNIYPDIIDAFSAQEAVDKIKSDILALRKMKKCDDCGAEIDEEAKFCPKCGKEQSTIKAEVSEATEDAEEVEVEVEEEKKDEE